MAMRTVELGVEGRVWGLARVYLLSKLGREKIQKRASCCGTTIAKCLSPNFSNQPLVALESSFWLSKLF